MARLGLALPETIHSKAGAKLRRGFGDLGVSPCSSRGPSIRTLTQSLRIASCGLWVHREEASGRFSFSARLGLRLPETIHSQAGSILRRRFGHLRVSRAPRGVSMGDCFCRHVSRGVQRVNGAQTVEPRATSGGTTRYSDWTDAPRALIVPNAAYEAVVALPKAPPPLFGECFCRRAP